MTNHIDDALEDTLDNNDSINIPEPRRGFGRLRDNPQSGEYVELGVSIGEQEDDVFHNLDEEQDISQREDDVERAVNPNVTDDAFHTSEQEDYVEGDVNPDNNNEEEEIRNLWFNETLQEEILEENPEEVVENLTQEYLQETQEEVVENLTQENNETENAEDDVIENDITENVQVDIENDVTEKIGNNKRRKIIENGNINVQEKDDEMENGRIENVEDSIEENPNMVNLRTRRKLTVSVPTPKATTTITPVPKSCSKADCRQLIEMGLHFNRTDLNKTYRGICPDCGAQPKGENQRSRIPLSSLMKTHLLYNCEKYPYCQKYIKL